MKKNRVRSLLALGLSLTMMVSIMGCGKQQRLDAEINPDTPVSDVQFPLKETEELSFITSAPATSTQDPNKRVIFQRMEEQTNVHIDWTCFVSDQFSDKKNLANEYQYILSVMWLFSFNLSIIPENLVLPEQNFHLHQLFQIFLDILLQYAKF